MTDAMVYVSEKVRPGTRELNGTPCGLFGGEACGCRTYST